MFTARGSTIVGHGKLDALNAARSGGFFALAFTRIENQAIQTIRAVFVPKARSFDF